MQEFSFDRRQVNCSDALQEKGFLHICRAVECLCKRSRPRMPGASQIMHVRQAVEGPDRPEVAVRVW